MAIPKYNELYDPFLTAISDGKIHTAKEVASTVANILQLSPEDLAEQLPSQRQTTFANRLNWAKTYLKKAGLVDSPKRGTYIITTAGSTLLHSDVAITNEFLESNYPSFAAFVNRTDDVDTANDTASITPSDTQTPEEQMDALHNTINDTLADDLLAEIMQQTPVFFEQLVVDLMKAMDYGDGFKTKSSGDDGIDGVIHEDKLGFNLIYIQAKRWNPDVTIGKPEIQKFFGAMMGPPRVEKGLFITTAKFSKGAKEYADAQHIILVDGQKLTSLMIECGLGVSVQKVYQIKRIDSDYFYDSLSSRFWSDSIARVVTVCASLGAVIGRGKQCGFAAKRWFLHERLVSAVYGGPIWVRPVRRFPVYFVAYPYCHRRVGVAGAVLAGAGGHRLQLFPHFEPQHPQAVQ